MSAKSKKRDFKGFDELINTLSDELREKSKAHLLVVVAVKNKHQVVVHGSGDGSSDDLDALRAGLEGALEKIAGDDEDTDRLKRKLMKAAKRNGILDKDGKPTKKAIASLIASILTDKDSGPVAALNDMSGSPLSDDEVEQLEEAWEDEEDDEDEDED